MINTSKSRVAFATTIVALLSSVDHTAHAAREGFNEIAIDFDGTQPLGVVLPSICIGSYTVPKTMYTIEPAAEGETQMKIFTNPRDLIETGYDSGNRLVYFKFNLLIAEIAQDAGVVIQFPPDQLESVDACCSQSVQIKRGFTNVQSITASTGAVINAKFKVQQKKHMSIGVYSNSEVYVEVKDTSGTKVDVVAKDNAMANIKGDVTTLSCNDESDCKISGLILDPNESRASGRSIVRTMSCESVAVVTDSICSSIAPDVTITVDRPLFISGEKETCVNGGDLVGLGGPAPPTEADVPTVSPPLTEAPVESVPTMAPIEVTEAPVAAPVAAPVEAPVEAPTFTFAPYSLTMSPTTSAAFQTSNKLGLFTSIAIGGAAFFSVLVQ